MGVDGLGSWTCGTQERGDVKIKSQRIEQATDTHVAVNLVCACNMADRIMKAKAVYEISNCTAGQMRTAPAEAARSATQTASTAAADAMVFVGCQKSLHAEASSQLDPASMLPTVSCMWLMISHSAQVHDARPCERRREGCNHYATFVTFETRFTGVSGACRSSWRAAPRIMFVIFQPGSFPTSVRDPL
jgi:hypothetical protein